MNSKRLGQELRHCSPFAVHPLVNGEWRTVNGGVRISGLFTVNRSPATLRPRSEVLFGADKVPCTSDKELCTPDKVSSEQPPFSASSRREPEGTHGAGWTPEWAVGHRHECLADCTAPSLPGLDATDESFVCLNRPCDLIAAGSHHGLTEAVQHGPSRPRGTKARIPGQQSVCPLSSSHPSTGFLQCLSLIHI